MRWKTRLAGPAFALAVGAAMASPERAAAQGVRLIPQVGLYVPLSDLGRAGTGEDAVEIARMESTLALGLALELAARRPLSFRVNGVYGTQSDVPVERVGCPDCRARSTVALLTGSAVFRPIPNLIVAQPYLQGGAGLKRYDFDLDHARQEGVDAFVSDRNEFTGQLGVGVEVNLALARLLFEVSDFISGFRPGNGVSGEGNTQHDFFITVGLAVGP